MTSPRPSATTVSVLHPLTSLTEPLDWARVFAAPQPVELDLGSGDGSFLIEYAARHPERNFLGVERLLGRLRKLDRRARRAGLENVRGLRIEARYFIQYLTPPASLAALHVYFPDPWPKKRHHKNRLINPAFAAQARRVLSPGGVLYLRTDHADYFAQMREVMGAAAGFTAAETPAELASVWTDFERDFRAEGKASLNAAYRRAD